MFKERDTKEILMLTSACVTLASGILLSFLSFFLSTEHSIHDSVLWYFAQTLIYAGSAFGISAYIHGKLNEFSQTNGINKKAADKIK